MLLLSGVSKFLWLLKKCWLTMCCGHTTFWSNDHLIYSGISSELPVLASIFPFSGIIFFIHLIVKLCTYICFIYIFVLIFSFQPFWRTVSYTDSRGRGVVGETLTKQISYYMLRFQTWVSFERLHNFFLGVLEANFIEPIHNKQDFEKTSVFQKLEVRLKEMTFEYW